jgi:hypothetical protein
LIFEFPAVGGLITSSILRTVKLIRYVQAFDYFVLGCEIIFALFIVYYTIEEIIEVSQTRFSRVFDKNNNNKQIIVDIDRYGMFVGHISNQL